MFSFGFDFQFTNNSFPFSFIECFALISSFLFSSFMWVFFPSYSSDVFLLSVRGLRQMCSQVALRQVIDQDISACCQVTTTNNKHCLSSVGVNTTAFGQLLWKRYKHVHSVNILISAYTTFWNTMYFAFLFPSVLTLLVLTLVLTM